MHIIVGRANRKTSAPYPYRLDLKTITNEQHELAAVRARLEDAHDELRIDLEQP